MASKCPACGFESADGAPWCDFCKEPFNKKKTEPAPQAAAQQPAVPPQPKPAAAPPTTTQTPAPKLGSVNLGDLPPEALAKLRVALLPGQDDEKVPAAPQWLKPAALAFIGLVFLLAMAMSAVFLVRMRHMPPAR